MIAARKGRVCEWYSAAELAALALPGMPDDKRRVNDFVRLHDWASRSDDTGNALVRKRAARGGGIEYHISLLPPEAQARLLKADDRRKSTVSPQREESVTRRLRSVVREAFALLDASERRDLLLDLMKQEMCG